MKGDWASDDGDDPAFDIDFMRRFARLRFDMFGRDLFRLVDVPAERWMGSMSNLIEQMVSDIATQAVRLDELQLRMFLNWLAAHSGRLKAVAENVVELDVDALRGRDLQERFKSALKDWLESLPEQGVFWEYRTISFEIIWWRSLDASRLKWIAAAEAGR